MTSRNPDCKTYNTVGSQRVEGLAQDEALQLLFKAAEYDRTVWAPQTANAMDVVEVVHGHTLALIQAGSYVKRYCALKDYPRIFHEAQKQLLTLGFGQAKPRYAHVYGTFEASALALKKSKLPEARDALDLLAIFSVLHFSAIPTAIFKWAWAGSQIAGWNQGQLGFITQDMISAVPDMLNLTKKSWNDFSLYKAIDLLRSHALVTTSILKNFSTTMHPLIHTWSQLRFGGKESIQRDRLWLTTGTIIALVSYEPHERYGWAGWERDIRPHLRALQDHSLSENLLSQPETAASSVLFHHARLLCQIRDYSALATLLSRLFSLFNIDPRSPTFEVIQLYEMKAECDLVLGQFKNARALYEDIVKLRNAHTDEESSERLRSMWGLAKSVRTDGDNVMARRLLEDIVRIRTKIGPPEDPDLLKAKKDLSKVLRLNGERERPISLLEEVVRAHESYLPRGDPALLNSRQELARAYRADGQVRRSIELLEPMVEEMDETLAEDDYERIAVNHALGRTLLADGQTNRAKTTMEGVLAMYDSMLSKDAPRRLATLYELGRICREAGETSRSVELLEEVVRYRELQYNHDSVSGPLLPSKQELAISLLADGQIERARRIAAEVQEKRQRHPQVHLDITDSQQILAKIEAQEKNKAIEATKARL
jgi:tetratricopeptide (TPR) repeat protein